MKIKNLATATLALSMSATSFAALQLVENGDFSNGLDGYGVYNDAGTTFSDGGGYGLIDGAGWGGGLVYKDDAPSLASLGLTAGETYTFQFDMIAGEAGTTGIKIESWAAGVGIDNSGEIDFDGNGTDWATYTHDYTIAAGADSFKIVLLGNTAAQTSFDNVGVQVASAVPVPAAAWLFGSALAGLVAVRRNK
jgi:hypothetical protein